MARRFRSLWLAAAGLVLAAGAGRAQTTTLPRLEIGPQATVLLQAGQTHQFKSQWIINVNSIQAAQLKAAPLVWSSSDPAVVSIDANGLARALRDDAFAVITVRSVLDLEHLPGVGSVTIGAVRNPRSKVLSGSFVLGTQVDLNQANYFRVEVQDNPATRALRPGDVVVFDQAASIHVATAGPGTIPGRIVLRGVAPSMAQLFQEITVDLDGEDLQRVADAFAPSRVLAARAETSAPCMVSASISVDPVSQFRLRIAGGVVQYVAFSIEGLIGMTMPQVRWRTQVGCFFELLPRVPLVPLPFPGLTLDTYTYFATGILFTLDTEQGVEVDSPYLAVNSSAKGGFTYDPVNGVEPVVGLEEPQTDLAMGSFFVGDPLETDVNIEAKIYADLGFQAFLFPLFMPPGTALGGATDFLAIAQAPFAVNQLSASRKYHLPLTMGPGPSNPGYEGPTITDTVKWDFFWIKEIGLGGGLNRLLRLLGVPGIAVTLPPTTIASLAWSSQRPSLAVSQNPVWTNGGASYPPVTTLTSSLLPPPWWMAVDRTEIWAKRSSDAVFSPRWPTPSAVWDPAPGEEGDWQLRAVTWYNGGLAPVVSDVAPLQVLEGADVKLTPPSLEVVTGVGTTKSVQITAENVAAGTVTYELRDPAPGGFVALDPAGSVKLAPGMSQIHTLTLDCRGVQSFPLISHDLELVVAGAQTYVYPVRIACRDLQVSPQSLHFSGTVADPPTWMTKDFEVTNASGQTFTWQIEPTGLPIAIFPPTGTLGPGQSQTVSVNARCTAAGTTHPDFSVVAPAAGASVPVFVTLECRDDGGSSSGDPHLETYDGKRYDFQGAGEFVLTRDGSGSFEIQVRQEPWGNRSVSVNTAVAARVAGHRVAFYKSPPAGGGALMVDGAAVALGDGETHPLPGGGAVSRDGAFYKVSWPGSSSYLRVLKGGGYLNVFVHPDPALQGLVGLYGDHDGQAGNDFRLRNGDPLPSPPSFADLYDCGDGICFAYGAQGWVNVAPQASLFDYEPGQGPGDFLDASFPGEEVTIGDLDPAVAEWAQGVCLAAGILDPGVLAACILDLGVTGDEEMAVDNGEMGNAGLSPNVPLGVHSWEWAMACQAGDSGCASSEFSDSTDGFSFDGLSVRLDSPAMTGPAELVWPLTRAAGLDVSGHGSLWLRLKVDQDDPPAGWDGSPRVVLATADGQRIVYEPVSWAWPEESWVLVEIPLAGGGGWNRIDQGGSLADVNWIALEIDPAGSDPLAVGIDHLGFVPPPVASGFYYEDFEDGVAGPEWSHTQVSATPLGNRKFLGRFGNDSVHLDLASLPAHGQITVTFDLYVIESWDGNSTTNGPDPFVCWFDETTILLGTTFSNVDGLPQSYPDEAGQGSHPAQTGAAEVDTLGYSYFGDAVYRITRTFAHTGPGLTLSFGSVDLEPLSNESWGIDNVLVEVSP